MLWKIVMTCQFHNGLFYTIIILLSFYTRCCYGDLDTISHIKVRDISVLSNYLSFCRGTLPHAITRSCHWLLRVHQRPGTHHYTFCNISCESELMFEFYYNTASLLLFSAKYTFTKFADTTSSITYYLIYCLLKKTKIYLPLIISYIFAIYWTFANTIRRGEKILCCL